jgi:hypothetical protein
MPTTPHRQRPDAAAALATVAGLADNTHVQVVLFSAGENSFDARRLNLTADLADAFGALAQDFGRRLADRTPLPFDAGRKPDSYEVAYLPEDNVDGLDEVAAAVADATRLELFKGTPAHAAKLRFYVVGLHSRNPGWTHFIRAKGSSLRLQQTRKLAALMRRGTYDRLDSDSLLFDADFDAVVSDGVVLIANQSSFQRALGFVEQAQELARQTIEQLGPHLQIANFDDFRAAASSDLNMVAKLSSIAAKMAADPAYVATMTTANIIAFAEDKGIEIDTVEANDERQLEFHPDPTRRYRILKLLDDDYLHSQLTDLDYEANSDSPNSHNGRTTFNG